MTKYIGPVPLIEEHYHIKELIENQQKRSDDRTYHRERVKSLEERNDLIGDAKVVEAKEFYCEHCREDFRAMAVLQVEVDWSNPRQNIAFYKSKHRKCGIWGIRLVTDRQRDGYFVRSRIMRLQQGFHHKDVIQPHEIGYNMLYGKR